MKTATNTRQELAHHLQRLPADQIKKAVIKLLTIEDSKYIDWEQMLVLEVDDFYKWIENQRKNHLVS